MTFAATVRSISPSLKIMINFCYLHCRPEGSSTGFTHLSFPLHCFSNGDEIERIASWVRLATAPLSRGGGGRENVFARNKTAASIWRSGSSHAACRRVAPVNSKIIFRCLFPPLPDSAGVIGVLIRWALTSHNTGLIQLQICAALLNIGLFYSLQEP